MFASLSYVVVEFDCPEEPEEESPPVTIRGKSNPGINAILRDNNLMTCLNLGEGTSLSHYEINVLQFDKPKLFAACPRLTVRIVYDGILDHYVRSLLVYTLVDTDMNTNTRRNNLCLPDSMVNVTDTLSSLVFHCSCPAECVLYIQIGSELLFKSGQKYKLCEVVVIP